MHIIIKGKTNMGKTRSEQEANLRKEWGPTMNDDHFDKLRFLEKQAREKLGSKRNFFQQVDIEDMK